MLAFFDESGHPHAKDSTRRPVLVAVCLAEKDARLVSGRIHAVKRDMLGRERIELKGVDLLNRRTYGRKPQYAAFLEEFFSALSNLPVTIFAVIMEAPFPNIPPPVLLPNRFRYLMQRIELLAEEWEEMATLMFDGSPGLYGGLGWQFNGFLYRSDEGRACAHITDAPSFVDSETSAGIQIADMAASVVRQYEEASLFKTVPPANDFYLYAIRRWYRIIENKTRDLVSHDGFPRPGFFRMAVGEM